MRIRTKVWLLVVGTVVLTACVGLWLLRYGVRVELTDQSKKLGREVAAELVNALSQLSADAEDRDLAITVYGFLQRHSRIQRLQLLVERETPTSPSFRIDVPKGAPQPELTRLGPGPAYRESEHAYGRQDLGQETLTIELPVDLQGPWRGTLIMQWNLGADQLIMAVTERWSLRSAGANLLLVLLLMGFITDRVVVRRLETLARAMRDVEGGNLDRRVPVDTADEVGRLAEGFNRMLEQLSSADKEIREFSERMAMEVEAATQDLSKKNLALAQLNRLLNELRQENASKVRLATLGQLAAQLAHEIGTPLSSVSGHLQLALLQRDLPPGLRDRLEVASREIARIGRIVRDYLDSTRSLEPEQKATSLRQVLAEAVEVTRSGARERRTVELRVTDDPTDFVTDPGLLRQILINLLTNAFDAVERGGQVTLATATEGDDVLITVSDTGGGIAAEDLRRIFEPFYTTKGRGKGTGLGLAICRELVAALGGAITVESAPGAGSTFTVRLPRRGQVRPEGSEPRRASVGGVA
jgi:two-component system NtrC family sensor kinase